MGSNFISLESVKNVACVGQKTNKFEQKEVYIGPTQNCVKKKHKAYYFRLLDPFRVNWLKRVAEKKLRHTTEVRLEAEYQDQGIH